MIWEGCRCWMGDHVLLLYFTMCYAIPLVDIRDLGVLYSGVDLYIAS